ncbi:SWR1-complex protein 4 [Apiospora kogelbergensis]|uniref:SWR1-complex protein 4 n=1 Tax=Apiospora kogelbergensis TaxID=1337665 RepID=A0AAW0QMP4_9PEZI
MTSHDVREMLNLSAEGGGPRPTKKQRTSIARQNLKGLAREVQNLGGDNPIAIVPEISSFKKRRFGSRKPAARWEMRPFRNSARGDESLILRHWRRKTDVQPTAPQPEQPQQNGQPSEDSKMDTDNGESKPEEMEDSSFAKFNVKVDVPQYSEDQYNSTLANNEWTKDETDYLMETVRDYDLRWPLIWDRYDYRSKEGDAGTDSSTAVVPASKTRTLEDLKARYYEVAAKMMAVQRPVQYMNQAEFSLHEIMVNFKPEDETRRKKFAEAQMGRSKDEAREEESLLLEVRRILARTEKFNQERRELYNRLDYPTTETTQDLSSFKTSNGLHTLLQNLMTADKSKKRKSLMGTDGQNTPASAGPSAPPGSTPLAEQRRESIAASASGHGHGHGRNDSVASTSDARPEKPTKKGAQAPERRKLTEQEELTYGVSTHDRLPSGPTFRYDRINKILTTKSNAQHARITNTLNELDVPARLTMPTKAVVDQMEHLLVNIQTLLDLKKLSDKFDAEIKLEKAKKAEKEKANGGPAAQPAAAAESATKGGGANGATTKENGAANQDGKKAGDAASSAATTAKPAGGEGTNGDKDSSSKDEKSSAENTATDGTRVNDEKAAAKEAKDSTDGVKQETGTADTKEERPSSSGGHNKRSASVLSSVSDKSAKRQKK